MLIILNITMTHYPMLDTFQNLNNIFKTLEISEKKFYKKNIKLLLDNKTLSENDISLLLNAMYKIRDEKIEKISLFKYKVRFYMLHNENKDDILKFIDDVYDYSYKLTRQMNKFNLERCIRNLSNIKLSINKIEQINDSILSIKVSKFYEKIKFNDFLDLLLEKNINNNCLLDNMISIHKERIRIFNKYNFKLQYYLKNDIDNNILLLFINEINNYINYLIDTTDYIYKL